MRFWLFHLLFAGLLCLTVVSRADAQYYYGKVTAVTIANSAPVAAGGTLTLNYTAVAGSNSIQQIYFHFVTADRTGSQDIIASSPATTGAVTATVGPDWPSGAYTLENIGVIDSLGVEQTYESGGQLAVNTNLWFYPVAGPLPVFASTTFTVVGNPAGQEPTVTSFARTSANTLTAGNPITLTCAVTAGTRSAWTASAELSTPDNKIIVLPPLSGSGNSTVTYTVPTTAGWVNGNYKIQSLDVLDSDGGVFYSSGDASGVIPTSLNFALVGGVAQAVLPQLTAVTRTSAATVSPGQSVTIACSVSPGSVPVTSVNLSYDGPGTPPVYQQGSYIIDSQSGLASITVPATWFSGAYSLLQIAIGDATGHVVNYAGALLPNGDFTVAGGLTDPPAIVTQPVGGIVQPGQTMTLSVALQANQTGSFQWYVGQSGDTSMPITGATEPQYTPSAPSSTTSYWVQVTNSYGSANSGTATVAVAYSTDLPVIETQPNSINLYITNWASLSVYAVGPGPLSYQWNLNGAPVSGATSSSLPFQPGTLASNGVYTVTVSNSNGTVTSQPVSVTFYTQPQITVQPTNLTVATGGTAVFSVSATGGDLLYSWSVTGAAQTDLNDANGATLTIANVQSTNAGTYSVRIQNDAGSVVSVPVTLTVTDVPVPIVKTIPTSYGQINTTFGLTASASNYPTSFTATGLPSGIVIDNTGLIYGTPTASGTFLVTVTATNAGGSSSTQFTLNIAAGTYGPIFTQQPASQLAPLYTQLTLTAAAVGTPEFSGEGLTYQWFRNGVALSADGSALSFYVTDSSVAGSYTVQVTGLGGTITSSVAQITVDPTQSAPHGTTAIPNQMVPAGSTLTLAPAVAGTAPMTYQWYNDLTGLIPGATSATLSIPNVSLMDAGVMTLYATNLYGTSELEGTTVTVTYAAQPATSTVSSGQSVTLSVPAATGLTYQWYQGASGDTSLPIAGATNATFATPDAVANSSYWVQIHSPNAIAASAAASVIVSTSPANFAGTYFGTFASGGGHWAMVVNANGGGTYLAYLAQQNQSLVGSVTVAADGTFQVNATASASAFPLFNGGSRTADTTSVVNGQISGNSVTGQIMNLGLDLTGSGATASGTAAYSGYYSGTALNGGSGTAYAIAGGGQFFEVTTTGSSTDAALGTVNSQGQIVATSYAGNSVTGTLQSGTGSFTFQVVSSGGSSITSFGGLVSGSANSAEIINLSTLATAGAGSNALTAGFVISGTGSKRLLIRGIGPSLAGFGVPDWLATPQLALFDGQSNLLWSGTSYGDPNAIAITTLQVGAFALTAGDADCNYLSELANGSFSAEVSGTTSATGAAMVEIYDADGAAATSHLVNLSVRANVTGGSNALTAGFVIGGNGPQTILIRGIGPGLAPFGVTGFLTTTKLTLFDASSSALATNTGWGGTAALITAFAKVGAFALDPASQDSALLVNLMPGNYTAQVQSGDGSGGNVMIEVYQAN